MFFKIKNIILWPKDVAKNPQKIEFELDKINIITGESHKGKSSLIQIIDYCLGSEKCNIPVGIIREKTEWFGLHIILDKTEMLLARPDPGENSITQDMYMTEGINLDLNIVPFKNTNRYYVVNRLNEISGLSSLKFDEENVKSTFQSRASFRDLCAFLFQPQNIVANPTTLYYKADTYEHQEKLKTIFPLVLGAVTNETLVLKKQQLILERQLERKKAEAQLKEEAKNTWIGNIKSFYLRAKELGLIKDNLNNLDTLGLKDLLFILNNALSDLKKSSIPLVQVGATTTAVEEFNHFLEEEKKISNEIATKKSRLLKIKKFNSVNKNYNSSIDDQLDRLKTVNWFKQKVGKKICPFCGSAHENISNQLELLANSAENLESISTLISNTENILDKEFFELSQEISNLEEKLNTIKKTLKEIDARHIEVEQSRQGIENVYRFIGKLEQSIEIINEVDSEDGLLNHIKQLREELAAVKAKLLNNSQRMDEEKILADISLIITKYVKLLDIDRPNDPVELDIKNLTIKVVSDKRKDLLSEIGSGANWLGYHIATLLALHEYFFTLKSSHVPSFLVIDQPSQVYFPKSWPKDDEILPTDLEQVRKVFSALELSMSENSRKLQIIVLEHAPKLTWKGIPTVHLVAEWNQENALIPLEWIK